MFVEGLYEIPEVRAVTPGHLVRCGHSSPLDANFGKEAGAAAVLLLLKGISGITVVGVDGKSIKYMNTPEAIKPRHVDLNLVTLHENLGICFGRKPQAPSYAFKEIKGKIERYL